MSSSILYRRLAIVNILHGYYLDQDGSNYFELLDNERLKRLAEVVVTGRYRISDQLSVEPTSGTRKLLEGHKIIIKETATGFLLAIAVQPVEVNNEVRYKPLIPVDENMNIQFMIKVKTNSFRAFTNTRFKPVFPAGYYFTNQSVTPGKVYPSLSVPFADFKGGYLYTMGETAVVNNIPSRALKQTATAVNSDWTDFGDARYMGEQDRMLLPKVFSYQIQAPSIKEAQFELKKNNDTVKTIHVENDAGLKMAMLNFEKQDDLSLIQNGIYTMAISGSNNYQVQHTVYLDDSLYSTDAFAIVDLGFNTPDDSYSLLDSDGMLSALYKPGCPQFELRMLSRFTYWKYYFKKDQPVVVDALWENDATVPVGFAKVIRSKDPLGLAQDYRQLKYGEMFLPNPAEAWLSLEADKMCSDILIN